MPPASIQLDSHGRLKHFLSIEDLPRTLLVEILDNAERFAVVGDRAVKSVPLLRGKTVVNLFFEPSTRTRTKGIARRQANATPARGTGPWTIGKAEKIRLP